jgi:transposase
LSPDALWAMAEPLLPQEPPKPKGSRPRVPDRAALTGADVHDSTVPVEGVDAVPPIRRSWGRSRQRPAKLHADKAYDHRRCRRALTRRHVQPRIARRGIESSAKLGGHWWVVERTLAWFGQFRRLAMRYDRRADVHRAFTTLASALITWRCVQRWSC